jgi:hypothetical protein
VTSSARPTAAKILTAITAVWAIALFVWGFLAYIVVSMGPSGPVDGLGRSLVKAPMLMRIFAGQDRLWPGWFWFVSDLVVFWGSVAAISWIWRRESK